MTHPHGPECTCMLDGPEYPELIVDYRNDTLQEQNQRLLEENRRLKALLDEHGIIYWARNTVATKKPRTRSVGNTKSLPHLPKELQLKILGYAMTCQHPIVDPFFKPRREHLTSSEIKARKDIQLSFLATCTAFHAEGLQLFVANNEFVFTQVAALQKFAQVPAEYRSTITHTTLRVVGRYYDNTARKQNLLGFTYHPDIRDFKSPILARPPGSEMDKGIHAYCYHQFADFLKALQIPKGKGRAIQKLLPSLKTMRIDLVNFCDHLWQPGRDFSTVIRWHTGPFVDELIITGVPEDDPEEGVESIIDRMVTNEGVFASGPPIFASMTKGLKSLKPLGLATRVVRCEKELSKARLKMAESHPEGGKPPKSFYPPGRTIWKYTMERLDNSERKWIEFDRRTGYPADDVDMWSDLEDEIYDSDGNLIDLDEYSEDLSGETSDEDMPELESVD